MKATAKQLREEVAALRSVGSLMSNVCFNISQGAGRLADTERQREMLAELARQWDAIKRSETCKS